MLRYQTRKTKKVVNMNASEKLERPLHVLSAAPEFEPSCTCVASMCGCFTREDSFGVCFCFTQNSYLQNSYKTPSIKIHTKNSLLKGHDRKMFTFGCCNFWQIIVAVWADCGFAVWCKSVLYINDTRRALNGFRNLSLCVQVMDLCDVPKRQCTQSCVQNPGRSHSQELLHQMWNHNQIKRYSQIDACRKDVG